eukprot:gene23770-30031_t
MKLVEYKNLCDKIATEEAEHGPDLLSLSNRSAEENELLRQGKLIDTFLTNTATQLTTTGLHQLYSKLSDRELVVFFRNNHFSTLFSYNGQLFNLVTDAGYLQEPSVVWEILDGIDGSSEYFNHLFEPLSAFQTGASTSSNDAGLEINARRSPTSNSHYLGTVAAPPPGHVLSSAVCAAGTIKQMAASINTRQSSQQNLLSPSSTSNSPTRQTSRQDVLGAESSKSASILAPPLPEIDLMVFDEPPLSSGPNHVSQILDTDDQTAANTSAATPQLTSTGEQQASAPKTKKELEREERWRRAKELASSHAGLFKEGAVANSAPAAVERAGQNETSVSTVDSNRVDSLNPATADEGVSSASPRSDPLRVIAAYQQDLNLKKAHPTNTSESHSTSDERPGDTRSSPPFDSTLDTAPDQSNAPHRHLLGGIEGGESKYEEEFHPQHHIDSSSNNSSKSNSGNGGVVVGTKEEGDDFVYDPSAFGEDHHPSSISSSAAAGLAFGVGFEGHAFRTDEEDSDFQMALKLQQELDAQVRSGSSSRPSPHSGSSSGGGGKSNIRRGGATHKPGSSSSAAAAIINEEEETTLEEVNRTLVTFDHMDQHEIDREIEERIRQQQLHLIYNPPSSSSASSQNTYHNGIQRVSNAPNNSNANYRGAGAGRDMDFETSGLSGEDLGFVLTQEERDAQAAMLLQFEEDNSQTGIQNNIKNNRSAMFRSTSERDREKAAAKKKD